MSKRQRVEEPDGLPPTKKRKSKNELHVSHLHQFIKNCILHETSQFAKTYTPKHLSLIITEYNNSNDSFIYLSTQNKWKNKTKLKKSEKIEYLDKQIITPLQYLIKQFNLKYIHKSIHYQYFLNGKSTSKTVWNKRSKFWISSHISKPVKPKYWSNSDTFISLCFKSVCHFIQKESGTGVHIGNGLILSCAHVIASDNDDDDDSSQVIDRIGRIKYVIFSMGFIYKIKCIAVNEQDDLALLKIDFDSVMNIAQTMDEAKTNEIGSAVLADIEPRLKCNLFCIGNPSNINLESGIDEYNDFDPKVFHLSFGKLEMENKTDDELGGYGHSCFTYWGHSGAPIFNEDGYLIGLHNSWNDETGLRHAVKFNKIKQFIEKHVNEVK